MEGRSLLRRLTQQNFGRLGKRAPVRLCSRHAPAITLAAAATVLPPSVIQKGGSTNMKAFWTPFSSIQGVFRVPRRGSAPAGQQYCERRGPKDGLWIDVYGRPGLPFLTPTMIWLLPQPQQACCRPCLHGLSQTSSRTCCTGPFLTCNFGPDSQYLTGCKRPTHCAHSAANHTGRSHSGQDAPVCPRRTAHTHQHKHRRIPDPRTKR